MDGIAIADAAVVVTSPALQGERTAVTDVNGVYSLPSLPPGTYTVRFAKEGLSPTERTALLPLGATASVDAMLSVAQVTETVLVEGVIPPAVTVTQTSANITASEVNVLPMGRTPYLIAELMPGLTTNTPNRESADDLRRLRVRQRVPRRRRRRERQPDRVDERPLHRGRGRRSAGAHLGRHGRIRPLLGRRRQRHHQERQQHVRGQLPDDVHSAVMEQGNAVRERQQHRARKTDAGESVPEQQAVVLQRVHRRRTAGQGSRVVLRGRPLRELLDVRHDAGDGSAVHEEQRQQAVRGQADRQPAPGPHAAGQLHRQPRAPRERAGAVVQHRQGGAHFAVGAESSWRRQLQRRGISAHAGVGAVLAEGLGDRRRRRHVEQHPRFAVPDAHRHAVSIQRAVLRRERSRTAQQPPADGERHLFRVESPPRQPRAEGRLRELRRPARRRERTELDGIRIHGRRSAGGRRAGAGCRRPSDSAVRPGHDTRAALDSASRR